MDIKLSSRQENKILRILEIVFNVLTTQSSLIHIDVYSGQAFRIAEVATFLGAIRKKNIILTLHGGALPEFYHRNAGRTAKVFKKAQIIQSPSLYLKAFFEKAGFNIQYLPNSIDLSRFPFNRSKIVPFSILWVRAFTPLYRPDLAIRILHEVRKSYPLATMTMVGPDQGSLKEACQLMSSLGLQNAVTITGPIPNGQLYQYYNEHAVYINTTTFESFGVALVEAASCGIPIVSSKVGEIPLLWEHESDILMVENFNPASFAVEVVRIFSNEDFATHLSLSARKKAERFDWKLIESKWMALLTSF